jgi:predicted glutamine amidotransferase
LFTRTGHSLEQAYNTNYIKKGRLWRDEGRFLLCELFGMSAAAPTNIAFSFKEFSRHGGQTGHHIDGWGVVWHDGEDARIFREPGPAANSPLARFARDSNIESSSVISHIRRATQGNVELKNTQPFVREMGGCIHTFAHNGDLKGHELVFEKSDGPYEAIGDTDSEGAFLHLLNRLRPIWQNGRPSLKRLLPEVRRFADEVAELGPANFLYSDGVYLFAHGNRRLQPDGSLRPPGLYVLDRECPCLNMSVGVELRDGMQRVALIASVPLTGEIWRPLQEGELLVLCEGEIAAHSVRATTTKL